MSSATILVVDDEPDIRDIVEEILVDEDYAVLKADGAQAARTSCAEQAPDLVLLDIWMPDTDGITLLREWIEQGLDAEVIMISGHGNVETAVEAIRCGAYDFLEKPLSTAKLLVTVQRALQARRLRQENLRLRSRLEPSSELVGASAAIGRLRDQISRIAATDTWVLISGEPGSGKGVAARSLHAQSARRDAPFVDVSLAAIPAQNIAMQLFGAEEGGTPRQGRFEQAQHGTLFLDEIGDLDVATQIKVLSVLEEGRFMRIGGRHSIDIDVRVIAATNQDLESAVAKGAFREDLYYRLNVVPLRVPPLREHLDDIPPLVDFYVALIARQENLPQRRFSRAAMECLRAYHWPGNVRELRNVVQRLMILNRGEEVSANEVATALPQTARQSAGGTDTRPRSFELSLREARDEFERAYLLYHLERSGGSISDVAGKAGIERTHLYRKLKSLGIHPKALKAHQTS